MSTTLQQIMVAISSHVDNSTTPPVSTNTEYLRRKALINQSERKLAEIANYRWNWLYTTTTLSTTANVSTVTLPSGYHLGNEVISKDGAVYVGGIGYKLVSNSHMLGGYSSSFSYTAWITGNDAVGYVLNISPTPTTVQSIPFAYFSKNLATNAAFVDQEVLDLATDLTKCPNYLYLVYDTLAVLFKTDDEGNKGNDYQLQADELLTRMNASQIIGSINQVLTIGSIADDAGYPGIGA